MIKVHKNINSFNFYNNRVKTEMSRSENSLSRGADFPLYAREALTEILYFLADVRQVGDIFRKRSMRRLTA